MAATERASAVLRVAQGIIGWPCHHYDLFREVTTDLSYDLDLGQSRNAVGQYSQAGYIEAKGKTLSPLKVRREPDGGGRGITRGCMFCVRTKYIKSELLKSEHGYGR